MSVLGSQADDLRNKADELRHVSVDDSSVGLLFAAMGAMREAADTIESLRDRLQERKHDHPYVGLVQGKVHDRREISEYYCGGCGWPVTDHDSYCRECGGAFQESFATERWNGTRWHDLFGTPERAAKTLTHVCQFTHGGEMCDRCQLYVFNECDGTLRLMIEQKIYDTLLEWLRG